MELSQGSDDLHPQVRRVFDRGRDTSLQAQPQQMEAWLARIRAARHHTTQELTHRHTTTTEYSEHQRRTQRERLQQRRFREFFQPPNPEASRT